MCHAFQLLLQHGLLSFYNFLKGVLSGIKGTARSRMELTRNMSFMNMMEELHAEIEPDDGSKSLNESIMKREVYNTKAKIIKVNPKSYIWIFKSSEIKETRRNCSRSFSKGKCRK